MRVCLMLEGQEGVTWEEWVAAAQTSERLGFEAIFTSDHYFSVQGGRDRGSSDAWTNLAGLAAVTSTIRLGTLVSPITFREPAVLAKAAVTVDRISGGRVDLGMGAGWWEEEHRTHGFPFPPVAERFDRLSTGCSPRTSSRSRARTIGSRVRPSPRKEYNGRTYRSSLVATADHASPGWSRDGPTSSTR